MLNLCAYYSNLDPDEIRLEHSNQVVKPVNNRNVQNLIQEWEQNYHRRAMELQEEEVSDKPGSSSSFSSPSLSLL